MGIELPYSVRYEDYCDLHGLRIPLRIVTRNDAAGNVIVEVEDVEVAAGMFVLAPRGR